MIRKIFAFLVLLAADVADVLSAFGLAFLVLKGKMSLVEPRPYLVEELRELKSVRSILLHVRHSLTGLRQVSGCSDIPFSKRLNFDECCLRNRSFRLDIIILPKTPIAAARGQGAF